MKAEGGYMGRLTLNPAISYTGNKELGAKALSVCTLSSAQLGRWTENKHYEVYLS